MSTTKAHVAIICDQCRTRLTTDRTTTKGARGDARRAGWRVAHIFTSEPSADHWASDLCPRCRPDAITQMPDEWGEEAADHG